MMRYWPVSRNSLKLLPSALLPKVLFIFSIIIAAREKWPTYKKYQIEVLLIYIHHFQNRVDILKSSQDVDICSLGNRRAPPT